MDFLQEALGDELYQQVTAKLDGNDKVRLVNGADGSYIPKDKFDAERQAGKQLKATIDDLNKQLEGAKASGADAETLKGTIAALQKQLTDSTDEMNRQRLNYRIKDAIREAKPRNADVVLRMIDAGKVSEDNGNLIGLSQQLEALKKSDPYLFEDAPAASGGMDPHHEPGGKITSNAAMNDAIRQAFGR